MRTQPEMDDILTQVTPDRLRELIITLVAQQPPGRQRGVGVGPIVRSLTGGDTLGWEAYLALKQAIIATVNAIEGMRYVESAS